MWRDASGRLTFDLDVPNVSYASLCREIADTFSLFPQGDIVVGPDQMFWTFHRGNIAIGFDWDFWMGFMVVAETPSAEPLVLEIAAWLNNRRFP